MQRFFAMFSIVILLFMQGAPSISLAAASIKESQDSFEISAEDGSTQDKGTVQLKSLTPEYDNVNIKLPEGAVYDEEMTRGLGQAGIKLIYEEKAHSIKVEWDENIQQDVHFVLVDLPSATNELIIQGIVGDEIVVEESHSFKVAEIKVEINEGALTGREVLNQVNKDPVENKDDPVISEDLKQNNLLNRQNDTTRIELSQSYNNECEGKENEECVEDYYTKDLMSHRINIVISGESVNLINHVLKIEMPDEFLDSSYGEEGLRLSKPDLASTIEYRTEAGKRVAYITFPRLTGGTIISIPVNTKFVEGDTPEGYELPIDATLLDESNNELKGSNPITFKAKYDKPQAIKYVNGGDNPKINKGVIDGNGNWIEEWNDPVKFSFAIQGSVNHRNYESFTITDTLPEGAVFDPNLKIDGKEVNEGWVLSDDGKTVTKTVPSSASNHIPQGSSDLYLLFPDAKLLENYTNHVKIESHQKDKQDYEPVHEAETSRDFHFDGMPLNDGAVFSKTRTSPKNIFDKLPEKGNTFNWRIAMQNKFKTKMKNVVIDDFKKEDGSFALDERAEFVRLWQYPITKDDMKVFAYVGESGVEVEVERVDGGYPFPSDTRGYRVEIDELDPEERFMFNVSSKFINPESIHYDPKTPANNQVPNEASFTANIESENDGKSYEVSGKDSDLYNLMKYSERAWSSKTHSNRGPHYKGDEFRITLSPFRTYSGEYLSDETELKNTKVIDLLPNGLTIIPDSWAANSSKKIENVEIIPNYKGSGRTAVIFYLGDIRAKEWVGERISFDVIVNELSDIGTNLNKMYTIFEDQPDYFNLAASILDEYDLNENGETTDRILGDTDTYLYEPVKEVVARKFIKGKSQSEWSTTAIKTLEEEEFEYKLNVMNLLDFQVEDLMIYDVFPYPGDKVIVANEDDVRISRDSTFSNILTGPVQVPDGFTVYYSTDGIIEDESEAVKGENWQKASSISDFSKVTALKVVMDEGRMLEAQESIDIIVPMKMPKDDNLGKEDKAYNSFAISTNNGNTFSEANRVYNDLILPSLEINKVVDGEEEITLGGAQFEIRRCETEETPYEECQVVSEVTTDDKGVAREGNIRTGIYKIKETKAPEGYELNDEEHTIVVEDEKRYKYTAKNSPETPGLEKDVDGEIPAEAIEKIKGEEYTYNVKTSIPEDLTGYNTLTITDELDENLEVIETKVIVDGEKHSNIEAIIKDQLVTLKLNRAQLESLIGKKITLQITTKIKLDAEIKIIDNKAQIQLNDNPKVDSNIVPVMPPPEVPEIEKDIDGEQAKEAVEKLRGEEYEYNVISTLPENVTGYRTVTISDDLDERLTIKGTKVFVDGKASDIEAVTDGQLVTITLKEDQIKELAGKEIQLVITAKINADVEIEVIDNKASIQVNDNPKVDSNIVPVTPVDPPTTPEIDKDVEGKGHLDVDYDKEYKYNVITTLPSDIEDYEKFIITDKVDSGLVVNADKVTATVDGKAFDGLKLTVDGNDVKVEVTDFAGLEGKGQIELVITAKIHSDTNIDDYKDNKIPNTADLDFTNESGQDDKLTTDPVTVIPPPVTPVDPPTTPEIDKDVEGTDHLDIDYDKEYKYNVTTTLPSNIEDYEKFIITDNVDKGLVVNADKVTATVDGKAFDGLKLTVDGNDVKVEVTDFAGLGGKGQIELVITAKIHSDTDIDDYKDNKIPNTANLEFINESGVEGEIETDPVTVTPTLTPVNPPTTPEDSNELEAGGDLPQTATNVYNLALIGFGLMLFGLILFLVRRKRIE